MVAQAASSSDAKAASELAAIRPQCIAAALEVQQRERAVAGLAHAIELLDKDAAGRKRGLDESRGEEAQLLGEIERIALHPPAQAEAAVMPGTPVDRVRAKLLLQAVAPALQHQARALGGEIERVAALRREIAGKEAELGGAREALGSERQRLTQLVARRSELERQLRPHEAADEQLARLGREAKDLGDLVKRAGAAADKDLLSRAGDSAKAKATADPARPSNLRSFDPPATVLALPVVGSIGRGFGAANAAGAASQGLRLDPPPGATVVAPFDGQVIYAQPYSSFGLVLIIRHGGLYHSLLAGLGRIDVKPGDWLLAVEPVGAMPDQAGRALYFELRHDGRPVDPQPWLAASEEGLAREPDRQNGDQKVRE